MPRRRNRSGALLPDGPSGLPSVSLADVQLNRLNMFDASGAGWRKNIRMNARTACAKCVGSCCVGFALRGGPSLDDMRVMLKDRTEQRDILVRAIHRHQELVYFRTGTIPPMNKAQEEKLTARNRFIADIRWNLDNLIPMGVSAGQTFYRCAKFSLKEQRCTIYADRPTMCRNYLCGHAARFGSPPPEQVMQAKLANIPELHRMNCRGPNRPVVDESWRHARHPIARRVYYGGLVDDSEDKLRSVEPTISEQPTQDGK